MRENGQIGVNVPSYPVITMSYQSEIKLGAFRQEINKKRNHKLNSILSTITRFILFDLLGQS